MLDTGTYGAKVQSWRKSNPRDILKRLLEENPRADKPALLASLRAELLADDRIDYLDAVIEYWFANNYHSLVEAPATPAARQAAKAEKAAKVEAIKEKVKTRIREEAELILLDLVIPGGKALRDATGRDCAKAGGWFAAIAERVKPGQKVGAAMSEADLRALWKQRPAG